MKEYSQLYFAYCDAFGYPQPPPILIIFTFIQSHLHLIEVSIVFGGCEFLKNKVLFGLSFGAEAELS